MCRNPHALSQAFRQSLGDEREVGGEGVDTTMCKKSPREAAVAIVADKRNSSTPQRNLAFAIICKTYWVSLRVCFRLKKTAYRYRRLEDCLERSPKPKKKTIAATFVRYPLKTNGLPPTPTKCCFARICYPGTLLHGLIKIWFAETSLSTGKLRYRHCAHLPPLKSLGYSTLVILQAKSNATTHPKMGSLKKTIQQLWVPK